MEWKELVDIERKRRSKRKGLKRRRKIKGKSTLGTFTRFRKIKKTSENRNWENSWVTRNWDCSN
jgi:hypothetical protein